MDWRFVIGTLVPLALWIIWQIIRAMEDNKEQQRQAQLEQERAATLLEPVESKPRRAELDPTRFLPDARPRREPQDRPDPLTPMTRLRRERESTPLARLRERKNDSTRPEDLPQAMPVAEPTSLRDPLVPLAQPVTPTREPLSAPLALPKDRPRSPLVNRLRALLKDRESLKAAFALREILDRPVSQRRG